MSSIARDIRQQPFYWIERDFLPTFGAKIGPLGIAVYNALAFRADRAGRAFPGMADLSELTGIKSRTTMRRVLGELEQAGLIKINHRFTGMTYETNEYFVLSVGQEVGQEMTGVGQEMTGGGPGDDRGVGQEMTGGGSGDDHNLQSVNNNHLNNNHLTTSSSMQPLAAAADSLLDLYAVDRQRINGQAENLAAWIAYALTQPGLKNPVGYAMTRLRHGEIASDVFQEIAGIDIVWDELPHDAHQEYIYRQSPSVLGLKLYAELENVSDDAIKILEELWEAKR